MKLIPIFTALLLCCSCHNNNHNAILKKGDKAKKVSVLPDTTLGSTKHDSIAMAQVEKLPEYKNLEKRFKKLTHGDTSHHLAVILSKRPDANFKYYWVKVGDSNPQLFSTILHFYVDPKDFSVWYYDPVSDSVLSINQWRRNGQDYLMEK